MDVGDYLGLAEEWAATGRRHSGCIVLLGIRSDQFGVILSVLRRQFARSPEANFYLDLVLKLGRGE